MSRLSDLYKAMETLRKEGLSLNDDLEKQISDLEETIIRTEILPAISKDIEPRLEPIRRDLVLVVEYKPGQPVSVALSRKTKISEIVDAKTLTPKESIPVKSDEKPLKPEAHDPQRHIENPTKGLRVKFADGTVVWSRTAVDTFITALSRIGFEKISKLDITHAGYPLVGRKKRPVSKRHIWQHDADGWFIYTNISNKTKIEDLQTISETFNLNLEIEEVKPDKG